MSYSVFGAFGNGTPPMCQMFSADSTVQSMQQLFAEAGMYTGPMDGWPNEYFVSLVQMIADRYNLPWDGNPSNASEGLCTAILREYADAVAGQSQLPIPVGPAAAPPAAPPSTAPSPTPIRLAAIKPLLRPVATTTTDKSRLFEAVKMLRPQMLKVPGTEAGLEPGGAPPPGEQQPSPEAPEEGIPTWAWIAGGVVVVGAGAFLLLR